jgi:hypothetical protein
MTNKPLKIAFTIIFCSIFSLNFAQTSKEKKEENKNMATAFAKANPKEIFLLKEVIETFTFERNSKNNFPSVMQETQEVILGLKDDRTANRSLFYNDQISITGEEVRNEDRESMNMNKTCGNYNSEDIFYSDAKLCIYTIYLKKMGSISTFDNKKIFGDIKYFTTEYFHDQLPIAKKTIIFKVPDWLDLELKEINFKEFEITKTESFDAKKRLKIYEFTIKNIPAFEKASYSLGVSHTYPHILLWAKSFVDKNNKKIILLETVADLYRWYKEIANQMQNKPESFLPTVTQLTKNITDDKERLKAIYYWVQDNIRYIAFEDGITAFKPDNAQDVFKKKYGDCKGMANLVKEMLKVAGFDARLTWIGTSHVAYDFSVPCLAVNNHMICTVLLNNKRYIIDPTEKFIAFEDYAERIQGRQILIEDGDKYILETVPTFSKERNISILDEKIKLIGEVLEGKGKQVLQGERKTGMLNIVKATKVNLQQKALRNIIDEGNKNFDLKEFKTSNLDNREIPLEFDYSFALANQVSTFEGELYVTLDFQQEFKNTFIEEKRLSGVNFSEKILKKATIVFEIPEGYKIKQMPANMDVKTTNFTFELSYKQVGNTIIYQKEIAIPIKVLTKEHFVEWNNAIKTLKKIYETPIILVKN